MQMKCDFCGSMIDDCLSVCPNCGASNSGMKRTADHTPKTIEELKQWYTARHLPPYETTRFFIGQNHKGPKAFGIYEDGGKFIVYKNKADGSRAIRYSGVDEAYAVNEIYLKLKSEILNQKARQQNSSSHKTHDYSNLTNKVAAKTSFTNKEKWAVIIVIFVLFYLAVKVVPLLGGSPTYYNYNDSIYCEYDDSFYYYNGYDYSPINDDALPQEIINNGPDYEFDSSGIQWNNSYSFTDSDYYQDNLQPDYSDSDISYDWDSDSSWDSDGSDWGSDW